MQVHDFLLEAASAHPERRYIFDHNRWYAYAEVEDLALRLAGFLTTETGLSRGGRVAILWENGVEAAAALFAVLIAGGVAVPLNTEVESDTLAYLLRHSDAEAMLVSKRQLGRNRRTIMGCPTLRTVVSGTGTEDGTQPATDGTERLVEEWNRIVDRVPPVPRAVRTIDVDLAAIIYTSGSTGRPKGVMLSHLNLVSNMHSIVGYLSLSQEDRCMVILPLFYIYGLSLLLTHTLVCGSLVFDNGFMYPNTVLAHMAEHSVTGFAGVPATFSVLLARSAVHEMSFPRLRYVTQAGGGMPIRVQQGVADVFAPAELYVMYGATEAAPRLSYVEPSMLPQKWGSIGRAVPNVEVYVADENGMRLSPGTEGEIVARGSNIAMGYWKDSKATAAAFRHGLYFTGDMGTEDEDGCLYVTGRRKEFMKIKGYRVSPREIEECLVRIDGVVEAAVVGVPDSVLGEAPVAFVVRDGSPHPGATEIRSELNRNLAAYKIPREIRFPPALPKSGSGKILRSVLRETYAKEAVSET